MAKKAKENEEAQNTEQSNGENVAESSEQSQTSTDKKPAKHRPKGKYLASSGDQFSFSLEETEKGGPIFIGQYTGRTWTRDTDKEVDGVLKKAGSVMGYYFTNAEGEDKIIGNSHQMEKAMTKGEVKEGDVLYIEFLGKKQVGPKQVNQFDIILIDGEDKEQYGF